MNRINIAECDYQKLTVGRRIVLARQFHELTQQQLADSAGISKGFLSEVENNKKPTSFVHLLAICVSLGVSPNWVLTGSENWLETENNKNA